MTVVQSLGTTLDLAVDLWPKQTSSLALYDSTTLSYVGVYRSQPNVRICVDFIARNLAQLGIHAYRRISDTDRVMVSDHPIMRTLGQPNPATTRYRWLSHLLVDLGSHGNHYSLKLKPRGQDLQLVRVPPGYMLAHGGLLPESYEGTWDGQSKRYEVADVVHVRLDNPDNTVRGLSPLETLRQIIAEERAAGEYREQFWRNGARFSSVIERPLAAPEWSNEGRERWRADFQSVYAGNGTGAGRALVLEEGMTMKGSAFNPEESQYLEGRILTMKQSARMYHIPPPMVGILDEATYSNIDVQHRMLYQDCLAPWCVMLQEELELQLLPEFLDRDGIYLEFNVEGKLRGSFAEQAMALQSAVGGPWMRRNEARARMNLPADPDGDALITPLNVTTGGQASPRDSGSQNRAAVLQHFFERQERVIKSNGGRFDADRWERELAADLAAIGGLGDG